MKRFTVLVWRQFNYPVPVLDKLWFKMLVSGKSVDGSPCLALLCVCANCPWILLVHTSRTFLIVISLDGLFDFIHYIFLIKYCFLFPGKRNLESAARGCWFLCDFVPVNFPWSHLSSAAFLVVVSGAFWPSLEGRTVCVRAIANENGGVWRHGTTHRIPLQHLLNDRLDYSCSQL